MKVLLVSTYELGHQPVHVASPAAELRACAHDVVALDLSVTGWDENLVAWADRIAFSVPMHTAMRLALDAAGRVRAARPEVPIAFYGLYADVSPATTGNLHATTFAGDYSRCLADWVSGQISEAAIVRGRRVDVPDRSLLPPLEQYARLRDPIRGDVLTGAVEATHGCAHLCRHCPIPAVYGGRFRAVDTRVVLGDIDSLVSMGAEHITFADADFLNGPAHARRIVAAMHDRYPEVTFDCTTKVEHVISHERLWDQFAERGCVFVVSAFETLDDRVLDILDKGHTAADLARAVSILRGAGIEVRPSWLPFTPWTTVASFAEILRFLADHDLLGSCDPVQLTLRLLVPDGSLLLGRDEMTPFLDGYDDARLTSRWYAADPAADSLQEQIATIVAADSDAGAEPLVTLRRIWSLVIGGAMPEPVRSAGPRLTESWFCCAEPTTNQRARSR